MKKIWFILFLLPINLVAQFSKPYPLPAVENVLKKSGRNRAELETAIEYFKKQRDPLKIKAIEFLISNMDIHYSEDYFWADSTGKRLDYNEMDYSDFASAVEVFNTIKSKVGKVQPIAFKYQDIDTIKASYLIENVENAFGTWKQPGLPDLSFEDFCEYVLPYRVSTEPLQNWREIYSKRFSWMRDSSKMETMTELLADVATDLKTWFINTWDIESRQEPLPRLGALQLLARKKGDCDDIGGLQVFTLRSQGYPASVENVPYWATTTGRHFFNSTLDENMKLLPFDISTADIKINTLSREPSKVVRLTYSKQPGTLAAQVPSEKIPPGFLRMQNYKDMTAQYWKTNTLKAKVFGRKDKPTVAFACVFNGFGWKPTWWGNVRGDSVDFNNMCQGAVFLPMYYINDRLIPAAYPIISGYEGTRELKPDTLHKQSITIKQQEKYLMFRPGKKYKLYYWDNGWKNCGEEIARENSTELVFVSAPPNALYLLIPEYSQRKERPFSISKDGERQWW